MRLIKHIKDVIWVGLWRRLAECGIGDPLNQLIYVPPFGVVPKIYHYKSPRVKAYRHNYRLEDKVRHEFDDESPLASTHLYEAMLEIVGEDIDIMALLRQSYHGVGADLQRAGIRNKMNAELRQKLATFFNQPVEYEEDK